MTEHAPPRTTARPAGRPRSQEADTAILTAALDLLIDLGAAQTSIEQVARRAGVTRATVYRRFADKTALLVEALEWANHDHDPSFTGWRDLGHMAQEWAEYLSRPRHRRLLRRLYGSADDYPELLRSYRNANSGRRAAVVVDRLRASRDGGELPAGSDVEAIQEMLSGAVLHHLGTYPDTCAPEEIKAYLVSMLRLVGYSGHP